MKIALVSDFHLGYSDDALAQASEALAKAVDRAELVIIAGDVFDSRVPKQEVVYEALKLFHENFRVLRSKNHGMRMAFWNEDRVEEIDSIPFAAIYGTHERRTKGLANAIQLLHSAGLVVNVHARKLVVEKLDAGQVVERVAVQGLGGVPEEYAERSLEFLAPKPIPEAFNIFVFHQSIKELLPVGREFLSTEDLPTGFDLYVNGHIHWSRELRVAGKQILLPGSTVVTQMRESEANPKGFFIYDTLTRKTEFVKIAARPFVLVDLVFDNATAYEVEAKVGEEIARIAGGYAIPPLVKMRLRGTLAKGMKASAVDAASLERMHAGSVVLRVDNAFESLELSEKIETLRKLREEKQSVYDAGLAILKAKLRDLGFEPEKISEQKKTGGAGEVLKRTGGVEGGDSLGERLFELLSEGEVEEALKTLDAT